MKSTITKRSIIVAGHKTSVSLEADFWNLLKEAAHERHMTLCDFVTKIDAGRHEGNLSSAIRLFLLGVLRDELNRMKANACSEVALQFHRPLEGSPSLR